MRMLRAGMCGIGGELVGGQIAGAERALSVIGQREHGRGYPGHVDRGRRYDWSHVMYYNQYKNQHD